MDTLGIGALAAILMTLVAERMPFIAPAYQKLGEDGKRAVMLICVVVAGAIIFGLSCSSSPYKAISCDNAGFWEVFGAVVLVIGSMLGINQGTHQLTKKKKAAPPSVVKRPTTIKRTPPTVS